MLEPRESSLADLLACIAAFGRSMQEVFDPQRFLAEFSARAQRLVAHDRVIITYLGEDGLAKPENLLHAMGNVNQREVLLL